MVGCCSMYHGRKVAPQTRSAAPTASPSAKWRRKAAWTSHTVAKP
jgi:hypothetical protein